MTSGRHLRDMMILHLKGAFRGRRRWFRCRLRGRAGIAFDTVRITTIAATSATSATTTLWATSGARKREKIVTAARALPNGNKGIAVLSAVWIQSIDRVVVNVTVEVRTL